MNNSFYSLEELATDQNFALATLCKQKNCLQQWLKYLNVKNIYMPEEVSKYKKRIADINDAIKILEGEFKNQPFSDADKNLRRSRKTKTILTTKNEANINTSNTSLTTARATAFAS